MLLLVINLISSVHSFDDKYRFSKKKPTDLSPVTFFYQEKSEEFIKDVPKILKDFKNTRIIFKDGFVFSRQIIEFKKPGLQKIYCISDSLFSQDSSQVCMRKDMLTPYQGSTMFIIDLNVTKIGMFEISFLNTRQKSLHILEFLQENFAVDYPTVSQTINIKITPINSSLIFNKKLTILGHYGRFYPFVSWLGYSLLNPAFYEYNTNSVTYRLPSELNIKLVNYLYSDSFEICRLIKLYISIGIAICCFYMLVFLIFQICCANVCNYVKEFYFQPDISFYSMAFGIFMIIDLLSGSNVWIWLKPIAPFLLLFAGISIINKFTLYSFSTLIVSLNEIRRKKSNVGRAVVVQNYITIFLTLCTLFSCLLMQNNNAGEITKASFSINENVIKVQAFPIIIVFLMIYIFTTIVAVIPNIYFFKFNIKVYRASKDIVRSNLNSRMFSIGISFLCVLTLSISFLFYIISAKVMWLHQSCFYLFFSYLFYSLYLSIFLVGFNKEINIMIFDYLKSFFKRKSFSPSVDSSNRSSSYSKDSGIQIYSNQPKNSTFRNASKNVNYFGWIDSYFDRPPVFKNPNYEDNSNHPGGFQFPINVVSNSSCNYESQIPPPVWKSSGFGDSNRQITYTIETEGYQTGSNIYMLNDQEFTTEMFKSLTGTTIEIGNKSLLSSTPAVIETQFVKLKDESKTTSKKYRTTPLKINTNHENIQTNYTLSFEIKESIETLNL